MKVQLHHLDRALVAGSLLLAICLLAGCGEEAESKDPGALSLSWRVSPLGCADSGVDLVAIEIDGPSTPPTAGLVYACDVGRAVLEELDPGHYDIRLLGVDTTGKSTFVSESTSVGVSPKTITPVDQFRLTAKPARLEVSWYFDNGRLCSSNGVREIAIGVYDKDAYAIEEQVVQCESGQGVVEDLQSGSYLIEVLGMAADQTGLFQGLQPIDLKRGDQSAIEISLKECEEGC